MERLLTSLTNFHFGMIVEFHDTSSSFSSIGVFFYYIIYCIITECEYYFLIYNR